MNSRRGPGSANYIPLQTGMSIDDRTTLHTKDGRLKCTMQEPPAATHPSSGAKGTFITSRGHLSVLDGHDAPDPELTTNYIPCVPNGAVAVEIGAAVGSIVNGLPLSVTGRVACDTTNPVLFIANGLPFTMAGCLAIAIDPRE